MQTFKKEERLTSKKIIAEVYNKGKQIKKFPIKTIWIQTKLPVRFPVQVLISVPKHNFQKSVDRNRIKRKIREAYRFHKKELYDFLKTKNMQCALMLIYADKKEAEYAEIERKIIVTLQEVMKSQ